MSKLSLLPDVWGRERERSSQRRKKKRSFVNFFFFSSESILCFHSTNNIEKNILSFHNGWFGVFEKSISLLILFVGKTTLKLLKSLQLWIWVCLVGMGWKFLKLFLFSYFLLLPFVFFFSYQLKIIIMKREKELVTLSLNLGLLLFSLPHCSIPNGNIKTCGLCYTSRFYRIIWYATNKREKRLTVFYMLIIFYLKWKLGVEKTRIFSGKFNFQWCFSVCLVFNQVCSWWNVYVTMY